MTRRSIVLVTVDSFRADHCGFMSSDETTTPALDRLASNGLIFRNAIAPDTSTPGSLPVMFTGQYTTGTESVSGMDKQQDLIASHLGARETLAERFADRGYSTAGFTPNPWTSRHFGFDDGFDHFEDFLNEDRGSRLFEKMLEGKGSSRLNAARLLLSWIQRENTFKPWDSFYEEAVGWAQDQERPYFLWVFLLDPHFPYLADRSRRSQSLLATLHSNLQLYLQNQDTPYGTRTHERLIQAYRDSISYTDRFFERLTNDLGDEADIVVTGDHGEGFGEHGTYGHHHQLYEENVHVPLVISGDGWSGSIDRPVSLASLPDLMMEVSMGNQPGVTKLARPVVSVSPNKSLSGLRGRTWKYIQDDSTGEEEMYDLEHDPEERADIASEVDDIEPFRDLLTARRENVETARHLRTIAGDLTAEEGRL